MIKVTLEFASQAELVAFFTSTSKCANTCKSEPVAEVAKAEAPKASKPSRSASTPAAPEATAAKTEPAAESPSDPKTVAEVSAPAAPAASTVSYPELKAAVHKLAAKDRPAVLDIAASFSVKTFTELAEDKWAAALAKINAKLAEVA